MEHKFTLRAHWSGGLAGKGELQTENLAASVSVPTVLDGPGVGTNPEELLIAASATCYLITLSAILQRKKLEIRKLELLSEGFLETEYGLKFSRILHCPRITLTATSTLEDVQTAMEAGFRAEGACLISNALRGNVSIQVQPTVVRD